MQSLNKFDNSDFNHGRNILIRSLWYIINSLLFNSYLLPFSSLKKMILRLFGSKIGKGVVIKPKVNIKYPWNLYIGNYVWIGENVWIDNLDKVNIEDNVCVSQGVMLLCGNHNYKKETFDLLTGPIHLKKGSWIGAKSIVCPNVTVEKYAILTVNSVATRNLKKNTIYQGNPAKPIRQRINS